MDLQIFRFLSNFLLQSYIWSKEKSSYNHTILYTLIIIYRSEKEKKNVQWMKGNLRSLLILMQGFETRSANPQRRPEEEVKSRCHLHILSSLFCMYQLHLVWNVMLFLQLNDSFFLSFFFLPSAGKLDGDEGGKGTWPLLIASNMHVSELVCCVVNCLYCFSNTCVHFTEHFHITDAEDVKQQRWQEER